MEHTSRIIVIGASAGGSDALLRIAARLSPDLAAPILLVLHIGIHRSYLPELLNTKGPNRAIFARTGTIPRPGTIYVAPSDQHLLLEGGVLRVFRGPKEHHARPAINPLFRSAALDGGPRVVGVVLTGMLDDGAAGLRAIKACGGTAVVQDPQDAVEPSMPRGAMKGLAVDHVRTLDTMADLLNELAAPLLEVPQMNPPAWLQAEHAITLGMATVKHIATIGTPSGFTCPDCGGALFEMKDGPPLRFLCHTGHAFSLRSLGVVQDQVTDQALWAGLRAMQEKEAILRRLAHLQAADQPGSDRATLVEADKLASFIERMRRVVTTAPPDEAGDAVEWP